MWLKALAFRPNEKFISSFCSPDDFAADFSNGLGAFTPCFVDCVLLGGALAMLSILCALRMYKLKREFHEACFKLRPNTVHYWSYRVAFVCCAICAVVPLLQLNARLAESLYDKAAQHIAPYEVVGFLLNVAGYALAAATIFLETRLYTSNGSWLLRMPLVAVFAAQLAKLRGVLFFIQNGNFFFYQFLTLTFLEGALALWACVSMPGKRFLVPVLEARASGYEALAESGLSFSPSGIRRAQAASGDTENVCPEASAGIVSKLTFAWVTPLLVRGYRTALETSDIWRLQQSDSVEVLSEKFSTDWAKETETSETPSLFKACWRTVGVLFLTALPFKLANDASQFVGPVFLNLLLDSIGRGDPAQRSYMYAFGMFAGLVVGLLCEAQYWQRAMRAGFRLRAVLIAAVYRKLMFLTPGARASFSRGFIFNVVTSDADNVQTFCNQVFTLLSSPIRIVVAMVLLYQQIGVSACAALTLLVLMIPVQMVMVRWSAQILRSGMRFSDERTKLESDIIQGMETVKVQAWEEAFRTRILNIRNEELRVLWKGFKIAAINSLLLQTLPTLVTITTFGLYVLLGNNLTASKAFTTLALFSVLRFPLFQLPMVVNQATQAGIALRRLQEILNSEEQEAMPKLPRTSEQGTAVRLTGSFSWALDLPPILSDVDFKAQHGELVAIVGATGSGKSSLLSALLGLTEVAAGSRVLVRGTVAYVPQHAFIFGGTVRENILFASPFDSIKYEHAIAAANLHDDLKQLPAGDSTELGEGGINVSGGQKQRIQIARAVYADSDVIMLDDPLSALDSKVGRRVFEQCIRGRLAKKTRLLVTNQLQYARLADKIAVLRDCRIAEFGTFTELMNKDGVFAEMMSDVQTDEDESSSVEGAAAEGGKKQQTGDSKRGTLPVSNKAGANGSAQSVTSNGDQSAADLQAGRLTENEGRAKGVVSFGVLMAYVRAMGGMGTFVWLLSLYVAVEVFRIASTVWLSLWTVSADEAQKSGSTARSPMFYLNIFCVISGLQVLISVLTQYRMRSLSLQAADNMHVGMLDCLLRAPMAFYHSNPSGRITNRLTKDTSDIDRNLAMYATMWFQSMLQLLSTAAVIGAVTPFVLPFLAPVLLVFYLLYVYFQSSVREVKRLDSLARSPIFTAVGNVLTGLPAIRSFRREDYLIQQTAALVDTSTAMQLCTQSMNRWLSVRLETVGAFVSLAAAALAIEQRGEAGWLGLTLSYALQMTSLTTMCVRVASLAENMFNAVERVDEFSHVPSEAEPHNPNFRPPRDFPQHGRINFQEARMRYRPGLPLVLKGLTFQLEAGSNVGIVGRTGAGKTSVISALFRLTELDGGRIVIDGVDISSLGLADLRNSMALIPQSPVMFNGTLRSNLSPFDRHSEEQLWDVLRAVHLEHVVQSHPSGLEMRLVDGGAPLAAGQRQLVALARALLTQSHILVLDEATANVDMETDALIQDVIHKRFKNSTCIAVAHRLHTIIDCDAVLVMDAGQAAEFGSPAQLLSQKDGIFTSMVAETGDASARYLRSVARGEQPAGPQPQRPQQAAPSRHASGDGVPSSPVASDRNGGNALLSTEQLLSEAKQAEQLLRVMLRYMEDEEATSRIMQQFANCGGDEERARLLEDGPARATFADMATNLHEVADTMSAVKQQLASLQQKLVSNGCRFMQCLPALSLSLSQASSEPRTPSSTGRGYFRNGRQVSQRSVSTVDIADEPLEQVDSVGSSGQPSGLTASGKLARTALMVRAMNRFRHTLTRDSNPRYTAPSAAESILSETNHND